jgi:hypothetical protein
MKKMIFLVAVLTVVAFASAGVMAAGQTAASSTAKPAPVKLEKFYGKIEKIDEMTKAVDVGERVKVKGKMEEKILTFATDEKTTITMAGKTLAFADLKAGMNVSVQYKKEGDKNIAAAIKVAAPKTALKSKAK